MSERTLVVKSAEAYRTIGEAAEELKLPQHVLRFWETRFPHIKPLKRAGGRRFYRPDDVALLRAIKTLLYGDGYTIKGVQRLLQEQGPRAVAAAAASLAPGAAVGTAYARLPTPPQGDGSATWDGEEDLAPVPPVPTLRPTNAGPAVFAEVATTPRPVAAGARAEPSSDIAARLEAVAFDLKECERLLAAARSHGT